MVFDRRRRSRESLASSEVDVALRLRAKAELRKRLTSLREAIPRSACDARSNAVVERLLVHEALGRAEHVGVFAAMRDRHELDLEPLHHALRDRRCAVYYPRVEGRAQPLGFYSVESLDELEPSRFGIREPARAHSRSPAPLDVLVVPALGVAPDGHRIGYGGGYYDRTIPHYAGKAVTIAVVYDFQLLAEVPATPGDVPVDWIVTDQRVVRCLATGDSHRGQ